MEPIRVTLEVACPVDHAFDVWTSRISQWWPRNHTVTGEATLTVVLEGRRGGRIFERDTRGVEHEWGEITVWEPPRHLAYTWHLRRDCAEATDVDIWFHAVGDAVTEVEIVHRGWERLGADGARWREGNLGGWSTLLPHYVAAIGGPTET